MSLDSSRGNQGTVWSGRPAPAQQDQVHRTREIAPPVSPSRWPSLCSPPSRRYHSSPAADFYLSPFDGGKRLHVGWVASAGGETESEHSVTFYPG